MTPTPPTDRTVHVTDAEGTVLDWLTTPVHRAPADDLDRLLDPEADAWEGRWVLTNGPDVSALKEELAALHPLPGDQPLPTPVEGGPAHWTADGTRREDTWRRVRTGSDGLLDWSDFCFTPEYRLALAATVLEVDQAEWRDVEVHTTGPFVLWADGREVLRGTRVSYMEPEVHRVRLRLPSRTTTLHLATWQVAFREVRHVARVRVVGLPVRVVIPSPGADETVARLADTVLAAVGSPSWAQRGDGPVTLQAPPGVALRARCGPGEPWQHVRSDDEGAVRVELTTRAAGAGGILDSGEVTVELGLDDPRCPQTVSLAVAVLPGDTRLEPQGTPADWRREVLEHVAGHTPDSPRTTGVARLLARHALDPSVRVTRAELAAALERVTSRGDCADFDLVGLLLAWHLLPADAWPAELRAETAAALTGMKYWITQPGLDAMCYFTENHQFVWHVAQTLAGQTFPEEVFPVDGRTGAEHAAEGRRRAAAWIARKLRGGFSEFDSNAYLAIDSYALVALVELSEDDGLAAAARTLLDKALLTLAANSWRGIHGAAHGRSYVRTLRSARLEETSPILRLVAGVGTLNDAVLPVTALALARRYAVPDVVRALAGSEPDAWWGRQVYRGRLAFERDLLERPFRADLRVWRTPDVMLSSVQDYRAGLPGLQEHVWGATLGPELQVFVTHPANADTSGSARPNAWSGHRVLPRVHQHRSALVHLQRRTSTDPLAPHLWLPAAQADELVHDGEWLAARRGSGYVAVATPGGVRPVLAGDTAHQAWEACGGGAVWVAVVGREAADGTFEDWLGRVRSAELTWDVADPRDPGVTFAWAGTRLAASFTGPFLVDGRPEGIGTDGRPESEPHLDNPALTLAFDAPGATARWGGAGLDLDVAGALAALGPAASD